jgi:pyrimidine-nucleoside phosphorylase
MQPIYQLIAKKRDGQKLTKDDIQLFIDGVVQGEIPDYQVAAILMAIFIRGLDLDETAWLVHAMLHSGDVIEFPDINSFKVDKHSSGGVGDKVSLILAPLVAACGVPVPMLSGRGLGFTGGTLDKLESIPGYNSSLSVVDMQQQLKKIGVFIAGQTEYIAPADRKLYALRDVTGTVESIPLITASILSKKLAEGADGIVFDIKCGNGAFMQEISEAKKLAESLVKGCKHLHKPAISIISSMDQPLGKAIGNSLEVIEAINTMKGEGPDDIVELTLELGTQMLLLTDLYKDAKIARNVLSEKLTNGAALEKFTQMIEAQGGEPDVVNDFRHLPVAPKVELLRCTEEGYIAGFNTRDIGWLSVWLGAGRITKADKIDLSVGLILHKKIGDKVNIGDILAEIHLSNNIDPADAINKLRSMIRIDTKKPKIPTLIIDKYP